MRITIDTDAQVLQLAEGGEATGYSLFSPEAFRILSRYWLAMAWNLGHWNSFTWMGRQLLQLPDDVLRLAEVLWTLRPATIVETGVYEGGSTLFFAGLCRLHGGGRVISVEREFRPGVREAIQQGAGESVTLIEGDSASPETAERVRRSIRAGERVCVFLDSDHSAQHVAAELRHFSPLVSPGCYLIVADSICRELAHAPEGDPTWSWNHPGAAVDEFLSLHPEFSRERPPCLSPEGRDFAQLSYFPDTWLRRR
jgi:cephalosporin hydroxylase